MRSVLIVHALVAMALGGSSTHLMLLTLGLLRGKPVSPRLLRIYSVTAGVLQLCTVALGLTIYPAFKVQVVGQVFSVSAPWAAALFDLKEAAGLLGVPLAVGVIALGRKADTADRPTRALFATCAFGLFAVVAFCIIAGLTVVAEKGL